MSPVSSPVKACAFILLEISEQSVIAPCLLLSFPLFLHRFHICAQSLPFGQTVAKNPAYFLQMIWHMSEYTNHLIRQSNKGNIPPVVYL